ncbi:hypothetical protein WJX73_002153, partial [Symbiochloris irregularis]
MLVSVLLGLLLTLAGHCRAEQYDLHRSATNNSSLSAPIQLPECADVTRVPEAD